MGSGKALSAKKTKKKSPRKKDKDVTVSLGTDIAVDSMGKEIAQTSSSTSATSPPHVEEVEVMPAQLKKVALPDPSQVFDKMPQPEMVAESVKPVTFADLFKGNRDPDQGMILKHYEVGEGVLYIPDEIIKPVEDIWGFCLVGCFTGRFPGLKAVDAIVKSWGVPCRIISHCKGWVVLKFENDRDRYEVLGMKTSKAYGKEFRLKVPSHGFMFDFAEFTTLPVWIQLHNVPMQMWSEEGIGMLASKIGKPLRTNLVTKQLGKSGFCRVLVEVDFSKELVTSFEVACMGKLYTQTVEFEEDPKYCFHCKTWNHGPFSCRALELMKKKDPVDLEARNTSEKVKANKPPTGKEWVAAGSKSGVYTEPRGGLIPSSSTTPHELGKEQPTGIGSLTHGPNMKGAGDANLGLKKKKPDDGNMVGKRQDAKKGGKGTAPPPR
ncbi:unnamed protein product [Cuscuta campestris]|uniref:DUF4283 domain-containing protein n=1 Tax=Cuscuta campestris TaxID=132261 RepID=A0A484NDH9_9ASTE|nr:unnamed protein product [Cuscuta campestris]